MPPPPGLTAKEKRTYMADVFSKTQMAMSQTVDLLGLERRRAVPYASTWEGSSISEHGPIPTDAHLIPSNLVIVKPELPNFKVPAGATGAISKLGGKPWASFEVSQPAVFEQSSGVEPPPPPHRPKLDEEMYRAQYMEWTLQKNAFNPDIAAAMRTNVKKQASLTMVAPGDAVDPARSSENVKAALSHSDITGPAHAYVKPKLTLRDALPNA
jgi:hypothetical protein